MLNVLRTGILDWCHLQSLHQPHYGYCTGNCRFGGCCPRMCCRDCSGMTSQAYLHGANIVTGLDTAAIARDVPSKASWVPIRQAIGGDLFMLRAGSHYIGGPTEHVGIFVAFDADPNYVWTWESRGGIGHCLVRRPVSTWNDCVRYHALDAGGTPPTPNPPEDDMPATAFFAQTDETTDPGGTGPGATWWLLIPNSGMRVRIATPAARAYWAAFPGLVRPTHPGGPPDLTVVKQPAYLVYSFNYDG